MQLPMILAVARAEIRSDRRLTRYWVFVVAAVLIGTATYGQFAFIHGMFSSVSATVGTIGPRFLVSQVGINLLVIFLAGLIFIAFDVRARDERDRMVEVLDTRPLTNAEFLLGKMAGLVFITWLPLVFIAFLYELVGFVTWIFDLPIGDFVEPVSLLGYVFAMLTTLILWCAVIILLATVVRYRLLVAAIGVGLIALQFWLLFNVPIYVQQWINLLPSFLLASDLLPSFAPEGDWLRTLAHLVLSGSLMYLAMALYPRRDGSRRARTLATSGALLVIALLLLGGYAWRSSESVQQLRAWRVAHEAKQDLPRADMKSMSGTLVITPGDEIKMELELVVEAPSAMSLDTVLLTLNPGLSVTSVKMQGSDASWQFANGLLDITPSQTIAAGSFVVISLKAAGQPDAEFGYLDAHIRLRETDLNNAQIALLGEVTSIFDTSYVAMMPGAHWLPGTGTDTPLGSPETHPYDYFELDLVVAVPDEWLVAGPGKRQAISASDGYARFRFNPESTVPHVGLLASRFIRRSFETAGIEFEVLLHPGHVRNLGVFADAREQIEDRIGELFTEAANLGLAYPYRGFSLVESPNALRAYGGGWRMDSVQSMPGMMMLRENSFPTSRFEMKFINPDDFEDQEGGIAGAKVHTLEQYFENDFNGGNLFSGVARNFLQFQTSATGEGAQALNFVLEELTSKILTDKTAYFSAHEFDQSINLVIGQIVSSLTQGNSDNIGKTLRQITTHKPSVWDRALGTSLVDLKPAESPRVALNVLILKSEAIARSMLDGLGREKTAALVAALVNEFRGGHFTFDDFNRVAVSLDIELEPLLGDWLSEAALPGFVLSPVESIRLVDDQYGNPQYQTRVFVRNDENTPGLLQLRYQWGTKAAASATVESDTVWDKTEPIRIPARTAVEIGIVTRTPLFQLWTNPYLALNREEQRLTLPQVDVEQQIRKTAFSGSRASNWQPADNVDIFVDDLDPGFSIWYEQAQEEHTLGPFGGVKIDMDQGLPQYQLVFGNVQYWSRSVYADSWGKYRRTHALVYPGGDNSRATFMAQLPHDGRWRLSYHLGVNTETGTDPEFNPGVLQRSFLGNYEMTLVSNGERRSIDFDGQQASFGWNDLGDFQLSGGETSLEVTNVTTGGVVIADAIRWRPVVQDASAR